MGVRRTGMKSNSVPARAMLGLWHGQGITYGWKVTFTNKRIKRKWYPHIQQAKLHSDVLDRTFKITVTSTALRRIDTAGGFDRYILYTHPRKMNSLLGSTLKEAMLQKIAENPSMEVPEKFLYPKKDSRAEWDARIALIQAKHDDLHKSGQESLSRFKDMEEAQVKRIAEMAQLAKQNVATKGLLKNQKLEKPPVGEDESAGQGGEAILKMEASTDDVPALETENETLEATQEQDRSAAKKKDTLLEAELIEPNFLSLLFSRIGLMSLR